MAMNDDTFRRACILSGTMITACTHVLLFLGVLQILGIH